uniref:hypothetical protein n=1 Tax=Sphingomonas bacterium TaxID=1895847 RepID=UPI002604B912|nr:hypothetical protein [Sphingomonas bacterium]
MKRDRLAFIFLSFARVVFIRGEVGASRRQGLRALAWRTSHRTGSGCAHPSLSLFDRLIRFEQMPPYQSVIIFTSELMKIDAPRQFCISGIDAPQSARARERFS